MDALWFLLDLGVGLAIPIALGILWGVGWLPALLWRIFWEGILLGLTWELPFHFLGPAYQADPLFVLVRPWPLLPILQPLLHTLWDGGVLVAGAVLVGLVCPAPTFARFRWGELLVLEVWGVGSALLVESLASRGEWAYIPRWWNPALFAVGGPPVTLLPVAVWAVAPLLLYIRITAHPRGGAQSS